MSQNLKSNQHQLTLSCWSFFYPISVKVSSYHFTFLNDTPVFRNQLSTFGVDSCTAKLHNLVICVKS
ncbi:hypothetical protein DQM68_00115 [Leptospira mayottensis]|uniref:DUF1564 family protein n=1 Tax=Leptospira mayottensis TaxID=1137606 RepID=A0ABM6Y5S5_9LEPT|nr:hypothetical protein DQM68_00115 [Leptospira mayottensis]AXR63158.1 hypothetical protein DQM28_01800 [Leptospira mayottensis]AZQ01315.1 hypothetical protein LEP1GSC190_03885 [Leptospira mayottensis 200901116]